MSRPATGDCIRRQSWFFYLSLALLLSACLWGGLYGKIGRHPLFSVPAGGFILLYAATWTAWMAVVVTFPKELAASRQILLILMLALALRVTLLPHPASDDINRYLWEGRLLTEGLSPYVHAPGDPLLAGLAQSDPYHARINHPAVPAAYPPLALLFFAGLGKLKYDPLTIKIALTFFDLATVCLVLMLLGHRRLDLRWSLVYALNPLVLYSFAGQGHYDVMQNFFLAAALVCYDRRRWAWMYLLAGLSVQTKYVAVFALPFFMRRDNWKLAWISLAVIILPYAPFIVKSPLVPFEGLLFFGRHFAVNGPVHDLLRAALGSMAAAATGCRVLLAAVLPAAVFWFHPCLNPRFRRDPVSGIFFVLGALLMFLPTVHFWYLAWVFPWLALRPSFSWTVLSLSAGFYFVSSGMLQQTGSWQLPAAARTAEWLPFGLFLANDARLFCKRLKAPVFSENPQSLSIVIPARNEAGRIAGCVRALRRCALVHEVIVVDGGSADGTAAKARTAGALVLEHAHPPENGGGRGGQIHAGINAAKGDVVAIVHADTRVKPAVLERVLGMLQRQQMVAGGAIGGSFSGSAPGLRLLEYANDARAAFLGISFGDQVQFFRRTPVVAHDLFPRIPLMEDVEFSLRLHRLGRQVFFFGGTCVSARGWRKSAARKFRLVLALTGSYLWQRLYRLPDTTGMYYRYYGEMAPPRAQPLDRPHTNQ